MDGLEIETQKMKQREEGRKLETKLEFRATSFWRSRKEPKF